MPTLDFSMLPCRFIVTCQDETRLRKVKVCVLSYRQALLQYMGHQLVQEVQQLQQPDTKTNVFLKL